MAIHTLRNAATSMSLALIVSGTLSSVSSQAVKLRNANDAATAAALFDVMGKVQAALLTVCAIFVVSLSILPGAGRCAGRADD